MLHHHCMFIVDFSILEYSEPWKVPHVNHGTLPNAKLLRLLEKKMKKVRKQKYAELVQGNREIF